MTTTITREQAARIASICDEGDYLTADIDTEGVYPTILVAFHVEGGAVAQAVTMGIDGEIEEA